MCSKTIPVYKNCAIFFFDTRIIMNWIWMHLIYLIQVSICHIRNHYCGFFSISYFYKFLCTTKIILIRSRIISHSFLHIITVDSYSRSMHNIFKLHWLYMILHCIIMIRNKEKRIIKKRRGDIVGNNTNGSWKIFE